MAENIVKDQPTAGPMAGTFVTRLTAPGRGAIAVVRVWGPTAIAIVDSVFTPERGVRLIETPRWTLRLGKIGRGRGDQVVVVVLENEPPIVEVQCHGGEAAVALVIDALESAGARTSDAAGPESHSSGDSLADLALLDLVGTQTLVTAEILLDQAQGALRRALERIGREIADQPESAHAELDALIRRAQVGMRLKDGWKVAIAGRPNVGKSRLFNALAGFVRAIVDPTPGTTRDVVSFKTAFAGWPVLLADTAGMRESFDPIENLGIERSRHEQRTADLIVMVLDRSQPLAPIDHELITTHPTSLVVCNKSDLPPAWQEADLDLPSEAIVTVSAATGDGLETLIDAIVRRLVPEPPPGGSAVPFRSDQVDRLRKFRLMLLSGDRDQALRELTSMIDG